MLRLTDPGTCELFGEGLGGETGRKIGKGIDIAGDLSSLPGGNFNSIPEAIITGANAINVANDLGAFDD